MTRTTPPPNTGGFCGGSMGSATIKLHYSSPVDAERAFAEIADAVDAVNKQAGYPPRPNELRKTVNQKG